MPEHSGRIEGGSPATRAVRLAGALAEAGVQQLVIRGPSSDVTVALARQADLPGAIAAAGHAARLQTPDGSIRVEVQPNEITWCCADPQRAAFLHAASSTP